MYCKNCGKEIDDKAVVCIHCGVPTKIEAANDNGGFGWGLLGCCIPIVGLILFLVWKDSKPKTGKAAGIGALVGVIIIVVFYALIFGLGILGSSVSSTSLY
ncbi:MAG: zinc-ribbon domain-containing protein [Clostridium sp.]|uniref:zinc-ribbon domain-containing protein n=1 Tax=Clostridium sp. TaxID=1506 RepID=UPI003F319AA2